MTEETRRGYDPAATSPTRGPMKGVPDDQTPAEEKSGHYTGTSPDQSKSQESSNTESQDQPSDRPEIRE